LTGKDLFQLIVKVNGSPFVVLGLPDFKPHDSLVVKGGVKVRQVPGENCDT